jgi:SNF2 family DNA or RNA helicase
MDTLQSRSATICFALSGRLNGAILWSIFGFAMAGALGNRAHFHRRFDAKDDPLARRRLAARVRPFLLRRTKAQVERDLPDRVEEDLLCEMEGEQKTLYRAELKRARQLILGLQTNEQLNEERFNILTSLVRLRQICCHPALVDARLREAESAKVSALEDLLEPLIEEGHKALVFSQFVTMLDLLREKMQQRGWPHFYLAGETGNRGELVRKFQSAKDGAVFLISRKAGGFGLNRAGWPQRGNYPETGFGQVGRIDNGKWCTNVRKRVERENRI